jgi:hypothetical protein
MRAPKFLHDDIVKVGTGPVGTVKEVHQTRDSYVYRVQLRTAAAEQIDLPETELELVELANADETGFAIRYIT